MSTKGVKVSVAIFGVLLAVVVMGVWSATASATAAQAPKPIGPHKQANLPPLPFGPREPVPRPSTMPPNASMREVNQAVAAVFQYAAEHPEVLSYIPCFCGCDRMGHRGNDDCFVKQRAANGDVIAWEPHGSECQVCIDVAAEAMQMRSSGASIRQIRTAIDKKYAGTHQFHTPTPQPK